MRAILLAGLISGGLLTAVAGTAYADPPALPLIAVMGEASVSAAPDQAEVEGGVTSAAKTAREAIDQTNKAMGAVIAALKASGVADAEIRTSRLSLQPQFAEQRGPNATSQITGYRASNRVTVRVRDIGKVAATIDTLLAAGANDVGDISFSVSNASKLLDEARPKAIADARRKAEIYAKAAGVSVGPPVSISEGTTEIPMQRRTFKASLAPAAPTPVAAGEETLTIVVSVAYEIKPANQ